MGNLFMKKTETQYCSTQKIPLTYALSLVYYCRLATTTTARKKIKEDMQEVYEKEEVRKERRKSKFFLVKEHMSVEKEDIEVS